MRKATSPTNEYAPLDVFYPSPAIDTAFRGPPKDPAYVFTGFTILPAASIMR